MNFIKKLLARFNAKELLDMFKPQLVKRFKIEADKRQPEDINIFLKVVDKYDHGLSGEQLEDLANKLHDAAEQIIVNRINKL